MSGQDEQKTRRAKRTAVADFSVRGAAVLQHILDQAALRGTPNTYGLAQPNLIDTLTERMKARRRDRKMQVGRDLGGRRKKGIRKCPRIFEWIVRELERDPDATNKQLATRFPDDDADLYRFDDGGRLEGEERHFANDGHGRLSRHGFNRYVKDARRHLGLARKSPSRRT